MNRRELGALGEALALRYMQERGFVLLAKNYRALRCEIDLVLRDGKTIVFAEVKTRDRKSTRLNSSHITRSRMPSSA